MKIGIARSRFMPAAGLCAALAMTSFATAAHAEYGVRNYLSQGAGVIDHIDIDGATQSSENFGSNIQSHVDLEAGTVKTYLKLTGPDAGGSGYGQAMGAFTDQLQFYGAEGTDVDFSFDFDGYLKSPARDPNLNSTLQMAVFANLYVFETGAGATLANFSSLEGALVKESMFLNYLNPTTAIDEYISKSLSGTVSVLGNTSFDVFATLSTSASLNSNPVTIEMDFLNTATFGLQAAPGVTYSSASGVFPGSVAAAAVPEPATWAMMIMGFGLAGSVLRRNRRTLALAA